MVRIRHIGVIKTATTATVAFGIVAVTSAALLAFFLGLASMSGSSSTVVSPGWS